MLGSASCSAVPSNRKQTSAQKRRATGLSVVEKRPEVEGTKIKGEKGREAELERLLTKS